MHKCNNASSSLNNLISGQKWQKFGVWWQIQPINGTEIDGSYRSEANVTSWRHILIESDKAPADLWIRVLVQLRRPIVAIYESGGRSIHAIVRVNAADKSELEAVIANERATWLELGADRGAMKAVQLSRLPGCYRGDKMQRLLYLNPNATAEPIWLGF